MEQDDPKVEIRLIKARLDAIQKSIEEVKVAVTDLIKIGTAVAVLQKTQEAHVEKLSDMDDRVDALERRVATNSAYLNKIRGGFSLTVTLMTLLQAAVLAGASWLLSSVLDTRESLTVMQQNVRHLEMEQSRLITAILKADRADK